MQPFLLQPAFKDYLWGGSKLKSEFNKKSDFEIVAESWEVSAHPDGSSTVASGAYAGVSFAELIKKEPSICGNKCKNSAEFPVLIKLIDAKQSLSIQVHPDDAYAKAKEGGFGKTEMWIVLNCEPDAFLYLGFEHSITKQEMKTRIENGTLTEVLHKVKVEKGTVVFIPAGTIHAIGAGIVLAEIQQNSNSTYRVFDFGRKDANGNTRELHIEKALDVTKLEPADTAIVGETPAKQENGFIEKRLAQCEYFTVHKVNLQGEKTLEKSVETFIAIVCTDGEGVLRSEEECLPLVKGSSAFIPAGQGEVVLAGKGEFIVTSL